MPKSKDPATAQRYIEAGVDPRDPLARTKYHRWKKKQESADKVADRPANVPASDRRLSRNEIMAERYATDPKLQEWSAEIRRLVEQQTDNRIKRKSIDAEADRLFALFLDQMEQGKEIRKQGEALKSRLSQFRSMCRKRRSSMAQSLYAKRANVLRKELGLPKIVKSK